MNLKIEEVILAYDQNLRNVLMKMRKKKKYLARTGDVPYSYVLPKNEDINRCRPLVSYFRHPHKRLFNVCSKAIMGLLKVLDNKHCVLWKTGDLLNELKKKVDCLLKKRNVVC